MATGSTRTRLAVLGSPVAHSLSPKLHAAAYDVLGLDWSYEPFDVTGESLPGFLDSCGDEWRGLSLTMPLKRDVIPLLDSVDRVAELTGVANTLRFDGGKRHGFNTDVAGISRSFVQAGVPALDEVVILGGGATAASALVAVADLGARSAHFWVRTPARASAIRSLADTLGIAIEVRAFTDLGSGGDAPDAIISTLPNGTVVDLIVAQEVREHAVLFDVAYDPWPTPLAVAWMDVSGRVIPGIDMLVNQALVQVRIFVSGDPDEELPDEDRVLTAMWESLRQA